MGKAVSTMGKVADDDVLAGRISVVASLRNVTVVAALRFADPLSEFLEQVAAAGMVMHGIHQSVGSPLAGAAIVGQVAFDAVGAHRLAGPGRGEGGDHGEEGQ